MNNQITYSDLILLNEDILTNAHELIDCGADKIELMMDGHAWNDMEDIFEVLAEELRKLPVDFSVHPPAWDINLTSENKAVRKTAFDEYKKAIEFAGMIGAKHVVIHPGFCFSPVFDKKQAQQRSAAYIKQLCDIAKPLDVHLAVENVGYQGSALFSEEEFGHFLDEIDDTAGYLIDIGHAQLDNWNIPKVIHTVKGRLLGLHIHDNFGEADEHLPIGKGKINWDDILDALNDIHPDCELILEYAPGTPLEHLRHGKAFLKQKHIVG
ncbi:MULTISPECIES: sugar phosphate isomerase/epimerase family protein [Oceanobacillus]|uniref:Sugar phosphate isomerase/epimerase family protein n=1 Tax=Oceanobacillus aidingensis TaxID=645964 RepID=A0ABV9K0I8_9BACI|nr:sugar phosphate isomerase/epimerase family protein [Oceanobacillus oncorhynchi]MDM8101232.1 sugar phosphate isomerase/epimerase family protein [Oceanobacillus oncorhynchi]